MSELLDMLRVQARLHRKQGANALGQLFESAIEEIQLLNKTYNQLFDAFQDCQGELAKANERVEHLKQCISVYHSGIVDMFPHPSVTDGTFFVPIEKYNSMVIKLAELSSKQEQVLANNHSSCELECGAYGTYCKCQDKQLRKEQASD